MPSVPTRIRRRLKTLHRNWREFMFVVKGVLSTDHPVQVHIVPMRRCNLSCTYCNEFDDVSKPVALETMIERVDKLGALRTTLITISGGEHPQDALTIAYRAIELGFTSTVGIIHDGTGQLKPLRPEELEVFDKIKSLNKSHYSALNGFQENIAHGRPNEWRCRSGARYLYICEDGLVHYCSQQRGYPGVPLLDYGVEDIRREFRTEKPCAPNCTVSCAHQTAIMDYWRVPQTLRAFSHHRPRSTPQAQPDGSDVLVQVE